MAVGPFEPVASCVTGGTGVANDRVWGRARREAEPAPSVRGSFPRVLLNAMVIAMAQENCVGERWGRERFVREIEISVVFSMVAQTLSLAIAVTGRAPQ